jgi:hypothetical protein
MTATTPLSQRPGARGVTMFYRVLAVLLAAFFAAVAAVSLAVWVKNGHAASLVSIVTPVWLAWAVLCFFMLRKIEGTRWTSAAVFVLALLPRLALAFVQTYTPTSDFANYWTLGQAFVQGDNSLIATMVAQYRILEFSGLAALWGGMQWISGGTMFGFQCLQCIITSGIAVLIYLLGNKADRLVGLIAAALYALYPSNLAMSQVFTNQHLATLLALSAILLYLRGMEAKDIGRRVLYGTLAGLALLVSHYAHPSSLITMIAFILYAVLICIDLKDQIPRVLCVLAACLIAFYGGKTLTNHVLLREGYRSPGTEQYQSYSRLLVGLMDETDGQLDSEIWNTTYIQITDDEIPAILKERLKEPFKLISLFARKALKMWGAMDSSFVFYTHEANETKETLAVAGTLGALDVVYVAAVYLLAAIGLFVNRNVLRQLRLSALITAGWIGVYLLIEIQMRYRYYAMPMLMIFAALGAVWLLKRGRKKADA